MKYNFLLIFFIAFVILSAESFSQIPDEPTFRLYLIGDAGEDDTTEATLFDLGKKLKENPNSAVVFLGDNCYRSALHGLLPMKVKGYDGSKITKARIMSQLNILKGYKGSAYFIPGNHDWWNLTNLKRGKRALLLEEKFIEQTLKGEGFSNLKTRENPFIPDAGHPGPVVREFNDNKTRVIFIDSYRLILAEGDPKRDTFLLNTFF
ncbi:MAG TPA: metallophosphoesterase, partial [Bacteroidia bacterium]|nr:metallophosphoesterase [Bacteroidia bacterium]